MAQDINFDITGDIKNLKKNLGKSKSLIRNFNKFNDRSSKNRVRFEKRASDNILRNRMKMMRRTVRLEGQQARKIEKIWKRSAKKSKKFGFGFGRATGAKSSAGLMGALPALGAAGAMAGAAIAGAVALAGRAAIGAAKNIAKFDLALTRLAGTQDLTIDQQADLRESINNTSVLTAVNRDVLLGAITNIVDKSGDIELATSRVEKLGEIIKVVGEESAPEMGDLLAALSSGLSGTGVDIFEALESIISVGDKGNIKIQDLAQNSKKLIGAFTASGLDITKKSFAEYQALYQSIGSILDPAEATTAITGFYRDIVKKSEKLRSELGVEIYSDKNRTILKSTSEILNDIISSTGGSKENLKKIGDVSENINNVFNALTNDLKKNNGELVNFNNHIKTAFYGSENVRKKFERIKETSQFTFDSWDALKTVFSDDLLKEGLDAFAGVFKDLDEEGLKEIRETFQAIGKMLGLLIQFPVGLKLIWDLLNKKPADIASDIGSILKRKDKEKEFELLNSLSALAAIPEDKKTEKIVEQMRDIAIQLGDLNIDIKITPEGKIISQKNSDIGYTAVKNRNRPKE